MNQHPSYLALDRLHLLSTAAADVTAHVEKCDRCREYVAALKVDLPLAAQLSARALVPALAPRRGWPWLMVPAFAAAAALMIFRADAPPGTRVKGDPAVELFVKRGDAVINWSTELPLKEGDRLQLRVSPSEYSSLEIRSASSVLFQGPLPRGETFLVPKSFRVDASPGSEELELVFRGDQLEEARVHFRLVKDQR